MFIMYVNFIQCLLRKHAQGQTGQCVRFHAKYTRSISSKRTVWTTI